MHSNMIVVANVASAKDGVLPGDVHQCPHYSWLTEIATNFDIGCDFACGWSGSRAATFCSTLLPTLKARQANSTVVPITRTNLSVAETIGRLERVTVNCPFAPTASQS
jgi:hypothetical protein